jgi:hypothetical protein
MSRFLSSAVVAVVGYISLLFVVPLILISLLLLASHWGLLEMQFVDAYGERLWTQAWRVFVIVPAITSAWRPSDHVVSGRRRPQSRLVEDACHAARQVFLPRACGHWDLHRYT